MTKHLEVGTEYGPRLLFCAPQTRLFSETTRTSGRHRWMTIVSAQFCFPGKILSRRISIFMDTVWRHAWSLVVRLRILLPPASRSTICFVPFSAFCACLSDLGGIVTTRLALTPIGETFWKMPISDARSWFCVWVVRMNIRYMTNARGAPGRFV